MGEAVPVALGAAPRSEACNADVAARIAWTSFYRHEYPRLTGVLFAYTGDRDLAHELAQEAMACAWRKWRRIAEYDSPGAWTYRVAMNLARSRFRRALLSRRVAAQRASEGAQDVLPELDIGAYVAVRQAVAALPLRQRTALVLRYFSDLPVEEVARRMDCRPGTVTALTGQAIANLRERADLI